MKAALYALHYVHSTYDYTADVAEWLDRRLK
jgi:hypothetical protein